MAPPEIEARDWEPPRDRVLAINATEGFNDGVVKTVDRGIARPGVGPALQGVNWLAGGIILLIEG